LICGFLIENLGWQFPRLRGRWRKFKIRNALRAGHNFKGAKTNAWMNVSLFSTGETPIGSFEKAALLNMQG
jgi:hypothetical protein